MEEVTLIINETTPKEWSSLPSKNSSIKKWIVRIGIWVAIIWLIWYSYLRYDFLSPTESSTNPKTHPNKIIKNYISQPKLLFSNIEQNCIAFGWKWDREYNRCTTSSSDKDIKGFCSKFNGIYQECGSTCTREICSAVCEQICSIPQK